MLLKSESHSSSEKNKSNYMRKSFNSSQDNHSLVQLVERLPGCAGASWERDERQPRSAALPHPPSLAHPSAGLHLHCPEQPGLQQGPGEERGTRLWPLSLEAAQQREHSWARPDPVLGKVSSPLEGPPGCGCCSERGHPKAVGMVLLLLLLWDAGGRGGRVLGRFGAGERSEEPTEML